MRVYISGGITNVDDYMVKFMTAESNLKNQGFEVINPAKVNYSLPKTLTHEQYMKISYDLLSMCDAIYMMGGWQQSCGACQEYGYAYAKNMIIMRESDEKRNVQ